MFKISCEKGCQTPGLKNLEGKYVFDLKTNIKAFYLGAKIAENFKKEIIEFGQKNNILSLTARKEIK